MAGAQGGLQGTLLSWGTAQESEEIQGERRSKQRDVELGDTAFSTPHAEV